MPPPWYVRPSRRLRVRPKTRVFGRTLRRRLGFTLIETVAVLAMTAILAGTAAVALSGPRARAVAADAVGQLSFADAGVRQTARSTDHPQSFTIDLAAGRFSRSADGGPDVTLADLPAGVRVTRVWVNGEAVDFGRATVAVSAAGRTRSYAVGLSTPAGPRWTVVAGLTGQATPVPDAAAAEAAVDLARPPAGS